MLPAVECDISECARPAAHRGMCRSHYQIAWRKNREEWRAESPYVNSGRSCSIDGCEKPARHRTWCGMHYQRWRHHGDPLHVKQSPLVTCRVCGAMKHRNVSGKLYCKRCAARMERERRTRDPAKVALRAHESYVRRRDAHREAARAYYLANRDAAYAAVQRWRAVNPDKVAAAKRKWNQANPHKTRGYSVKRRAILLDAICEHGPECVTGEFLAALVGDARCLYCGEPATDADHVIPISRDGRHCRLNLVPACGSCNKSKNNRLLGTEWQPKRTEVIAELWPPLRLFST